MRLNVPAFPLYLVFRSLNAFAFALVLTYELAHHTVTLGLSAFQLVLVGVVLESMTFLFEIPTGVFADLVSRRLSVILGLTLSGLGFMAEILIPTFAAVLAAQVLWGIGFTFYSGAESAWIVDEIGVDRAHNAFVWATQASLALTIAGTLCGALLSSISISLPVILGASIMLGLGAGLWFTMSEAGFQPEPRSAQRPIMGQILQPVGDTLRLVRVHPLLGIILALGMCIGASLGGFDRLYTRHLLGHLTSLRWASLEAVTWLGVTNTIVSVLSLIGTELIRRRHRLTDQRVIMRVLFGLYCGMIVGSFAFALSGAALPAIVGFCLSQSLRNVSRPLLLLWINQNAEKQNRATVISSYWQANAFGQISGSPFLGWIGAAVSLRAALGVGTILYLGTLPLLLMAQRRWRRHTQDRQPG
jgi:DHA3 family tetracycline resistance protein-like MFS transporter